MSMPRERNAQELSGSTLQTDNEVYENAEYDHRKKCDGQVHEREGKRFDKWVIHRPLVMPFHNGSMREEPRYLGHR